MKLVAIVLAVLFGAGEAWAQTERVRVRLDWTPWATHAPIHLAQQKGWFKQHGLDVDVEDGNGSVTTIQLVGTGTTFDVGHASLAPMMIARDKGLPVRAIANFVRKNDIGLLVPRGTIKSPRELAGKRIIFTAGSLEAPFLDNFLAAGGLKRTQVELINVEASAKVPSYAANRGDGVFSTVPFVLPAVEGSRPSDALLFSDYGLQFPSFGLIASEDRIKARGPVLRTFASIVAGAWEYILAGNEEEAVQAIIAQRPQAKLDAKVLRGQMEALKGFFPTEATKGQPMGVMAEADWRAGIGTMASVKLIKEASPSDFYTNDLLDRALIQKISGK